MEIWDKMKEELDRAGKVAQGALDEGRMRLDAFRLRQRADKLAQELGYAVFRARQAGGEVPAETYTRLSTDLARWEADASRIEEGLKKQG
ncbi:MAG: hypothetical protein NVS1B4_20130 [Gemmatimonadaceae bacterium]